MDNTRETRCSLCFQTCADDDSVTCVLCKLHFHFQCTTWKVLPEDVQFEKKGWQCHFCRRRSLQKSLFLHNYTFQDIGILLELKLTEDWSVRRFNRKVKDCRRTLAFTKSCSDTSLRYIKSVKPDQPDKTMAGYVFRKWKL